MPRHRRTRPGWLVRRSRYLALWYRYQELLRDHQSLTDDHLLILADRENLLSASPRAGRAAQAPPVPGRFVTPSWAETVSVPVLTTAGLDRDRADALVRRMSLLDAPGGQQGVTEGETG